MSKEKQNIIVLNGEEGDVEVEVIEQTVVDGVTYLLVADVLNDGDKEIELAKEEFSNLQSQKRGLMQQLLTGKKRIN